MRLSSPHLFPCLQRSFSLSLTSVQDTDTFTQTPRNCSGGRGLRVYRSSSVRYSSVVDGSNG